ncbi:MAG: transcriptional repressor NrdR [Candidatus Aminicenantes bacterium]|nr:transcriptional repressor NrdR [Candidatus Aminicenantes bacterium]
MRCPFCGANNDRVIDSREIKEGREIRRRRLCLECGKRFTTYERIEIIPLMVIKKDGRREPYEREKVIKGVMKACEKRPVAPEQIENIADEVEKLFEISSRGEISTKEIGGKIMEELKKLDQVAYVRFASVYKEFRDLQEFYKELENLRREE